MLSSSEQKTLQARLNTIMTEPNKSRMIPLVKDEMAEETNETSKVDVSVALYFPFLLIIYFD